jgi:uncharacterized protein (DUF3084 family)
MLWILPAFVLLLSGVIAYAGDVVGRRVGRRHLRLFGLRPKASALVVAIISGMLISLLSLLGFAALDHQAVLTILRAERLGHEVTALRSEVVPLRSEVQKVQAALQAAQTERLRADRQRALAVSQAAALLAERRAATLERAALQKQVSRLQPQATSLAAQVEQLKASAQAASAQLQSSQRHGAELQAKAQQLSAQVSELAAARSALEAQNTQLSASRRAERAKLASLQGQLAGMASDLSQMQDQLAKLRSARAKTEVDLAGLYAVRKQLEAQNTALKQGLARAVAAGNQLRSTYLRQRSELRATRTQQTIYQRGALVYQAVLTPPVSMAALETVLGAAADRAYTHGARGNQGRPQPASLPAAQLPKLLAALNAGSGPQLLTLRSATNQVSGYPVLLKAEVRPNARLFQAAQPIVSRLIAIGPGTSVDVQAVRSQLLDLISNALNLLRQRGVPPENVLQGGIGSTATLEFVNRLRSLHGNVMVAIASHNSVRPGGPISLYPEILR